MTSLLKTIPSIRRVLFKIAICLIVFSISLPLILSFCNLEITNKYHEDYFTLRMMFLGLGILFTLFGTIKNSDSKVMIIVKIVSTLVVIWLSKQLMMISLFLSMCGWTEVETVYISVENSEHRICLREFGCGAYDSDLPEKEVFLVKELTDFLLKVNRIDTSQMVRDEWITVTR